MASRAIEDIAAVAPPEAEPRLPSIVAVAASAGGVTALRTLIDALPRELPAAVVVVQHLDPNSQSQLAHILQRRAHVRVVEAEHGTMPQDGCVYVAPPGHHLVVADDGTLRLTDTPVRHYVRPSADELFESVARRYAGRAIAVVLTGTGSDGAEGSHAVRLQGGTVVVQDPDTSEFPGMPQAAIRAGRVTTVVPLEDIAGTLVDLLAREQREPTA
jgi:two-component system, chemotaxis family, protein-glutamate methylesterase/glutaminase